MDIKTAARSLTQEDPMGVEAPSYEEKVSLREAADALGLSWFTIRAWIRHRRFPHYRCGRRIVISRSDIDKFLRDNRVAVK